LYDLAAPTADSFSLSEQRYGEEDPFPQIKEFTGRIRKITNSPHIGTQNNDEPGKRRLRQACQQARERNPRPRIRRSKAAAMSTGDRSESIRIELQSQGLETAQDKAR
jgi:hypothetical protein